MFLPAILNKKHKKPEEPLDSTDDEENQSGEHDDRIEIEDYSEQSEDKKEDNVKDESNEITIKKVGFFAYFFRSDDKSSLLMTKKLLFFVRILLSLLIFLNISLFASSNTGIGASVFFKFTVSPEKIINMPSIFDFGLMSTIKNTWKAHSYGLAVVVALFSCIWPYAKLIMMLIIWIFPVSIIKRNVCEILLKVLDALGK